MGVLLPGERRLMLAPKCHGNVVIRLAFYVATTHPDLAAG
jgi:hypothetical protein